MNKIIIFSLLFSFQALSHERNLEDVLKSGVNFILKEQVKVGNPPETLTGEWPSFMMNDHKVSLLGDAGKKAWDSNLFTTASIHNALSEVYKRRPDLTEIKDILNLSVKTILEFENEGKFGFWKLLPRRASLYKDKIDLPLVRRPNNYVLDNRFANNAANVPEDADDTAVAYIALKNQNELAKIDPSFDTVTLPQNEIGGIFSKYRDRLRLNVHYYNIFHGFNIATGAFMTWLGKEKIMTPISWLPIGKNSKDKPYIPYGSNEVDCVVNTNILNALATYNELETQGVKKSCKFVNKAIRKNNFAYCGLYYPNHYEIHYTTAKALNAGADCLEESRPKLINHILSTQADDGSFASHYKNDLRRKFIQKINSKNTLGRMNDKFFRKKYNEKEKTKHDASWLEEIDPDDKVQSTIYALSALNKLTDRSSRSEEIKNALKNGINFLLSNLKFDDAQNNYLLGGVFFAGGTLVRDDIRWRSDAYTTAIFLEFLSEYLY